MKSYKIFIALVLAWCLPISSADKPEDIAFDNDCRKVGTLIVCSGLLGAGSLAQAYALRNHSGHGCPSETLFGVFTAAGVIFGNLSLVLGIPFVLKVLNPSTNLSSDRRRKAFGLASIGLLPMAIVFWALNNYQCDGPLST